MAILVQMVDLEAALNEESWDWLRENAPGLAAALEVEVGRGVGPDEVRRFVLRYARRPALAERLQQAAAHLVKLRVTSDE